MFPENISLSSKRRDKWYPIEWSTRAIIGIMFFPQWKADVQLQHKPQVATVVHLRALSRNEKMVFKFLMHSWHDFAPRPGLRTASTWHISLIRSAESANVTRAINTILDIPYATHHRVHKAFIIHPFSTFSKFFHHYLVVPYHRLTSLSRSYYLHISFCVESYFSSTKQSSADSFHRRKTSKQVWE